MGSPSEVTALIQKWSGEDRSALDQVIPAVYQELLVIARRRLRGERRNHTLNTKGLVHEAFVKLAEIKHPNIEDRSHFYALATQIMRHILVDHAKARLAVKRGAGAALTELKEDFSIDDEATVLIIELEDALARLKRVNPRWEKIVTYRFFGGFTSKETAKELGISLATANREWKLARSWLNQAMRNFTDSKVI